MVTTRGVLPSFFLSFPNYPIVYTDKVLAKTRFSLSYFRIPILNRHKIYEFYFNIQISQGNKICTLAKNVIFLSKKILYFRSSSKYLFDRRNTQTITKEILSLFSSVYYSFLFKVNHLSQHLLIYTPQFIQLIKLLVTYRMC